MRPVQPSLAMPLFLIIVGALWYLKSMNWFPDASTVIACALALTGLLVLILEGINKQSIVTAPLLMYIGGAIYIRNTYFFQTAPLVAIGMMFAGCLMLLARSDAIDYKKNNPSFPPNQNP